MRIHFYGNIDVSLQLFLIINSLFIAQLFYFSFHFRSLDVVDLAAFDDSDASSLFGNDKCDAVAVFCYSDTGSVTKSVTAREIDILSDRKDATRSFDLVICNDHRTIM